MDDTSTNQTTTNTGYTHGNPSFKFIREDQKISTETKTAILKEMLKDKRRISKRNDRISGVAIVSFVIILLVFLASVFIISFSK